MGVHPRELAEVPRKTEILSGCWKPEISASEHNFSGKFKDSLSVHQPKLKKKTEEIPAMSDSERPSHPPGKNHSKNRSSLET